MWLTCLMVAALTLSVSCATKPTRRLVPRPSETARVVVKKDGKVFFNERVVTIDELKNELGKLKERHGAVWFVDEGSSSQHNEPVKKAIMAAELPIQIS